MMLCLMTSWSIYLLIGADISSLTINLTLVAKKFFWLEYSAGYSIAIKTSIIDSPGLTATPETDE